MARAPHERRWLRDLNLFAQVVLIATAAAFLSSPGVDETLLGVPELEVGQLAPRGVRSPRDISIPDPVTTERLRREAKGRVLPTYDWIDGVGAQTQARLERAYQLAASPPEVAGVAREEHLKTHAAEVMLALQVYLDSAELSALIRAGFEPRERDAAVAVVKRLFAHPIVEDKELMKLQAPQGVQVRILGADGAVSREEVLYTYDRVLDADQARAQVDALLAEEHKALSADGRRAVAILVKRLIRPNLIMNEPETERRMAVAMRAVRSVVIPIKRGESVVRAGERVTERHLLVLQGMASIFSEESRFQPPIGSSALLVVLATLLYRYNRRRRGPAAFLGQHKDLALVSTLLVAMLLVLWISQKTSLHLLREAPVVELSTYRYLVPFAFGSLLLRFVLGAEVAAAFSVVTAFAAGTAMDGRLDYATYALFGSIAAATMSSVERPRWKLVRQGFWIGLAQSIAIATIRLSDSRLLEPSLLFDVSAAFVSGALSALLVAILLPTVEVLFSYTTPTKLAELANLNHPLLKDLLVQAPGTYHHSIVVGSLAEAGARATGGDPLLARVGGYYHDVGKLKNPRVFAENSGAGRALSEDEAQALRTHVADGLELGAKHRLGPVILEIIAQHHGTSAVLRGHPEDEEPPREPLRYAGPTPIGKEATLVMLADVIESATADMTDEALDGGEAEATVRRVTRELLVEGQLATSEMRVDEIHRAVEAMLLVLGGLLERRRRPTASQLPLPIDPRVVRLPKRDDRPN